MDISIGFSQKNFKLIANGGFGDGLNNYAHSMAWFNNELYVGTMRGNFPLMKKRLNIGMITWPTECPEDPFDLDLHAEIWCYNVVNNIWKKVYKSPAIMGSHGKPIPQELGFRGMLEFQADQNDVPALYISTWCPAKGPGPVLLRSEDGRKFEPSCEPGLIGLPVTTIRVLTQFKGRLYTTPAGSRGGNPNVSANSVVYESKNPAKGQWEPVSDYGFGDSDNKSIFEMVGFDEHLYAGTFNLKGYQIWRSDVEGKKPYHWEKIIEYGAHRGKLNQCPASMFPFKGALYVGSAIQGGGIDRQNRIGPAPPELIRIFPDGHWDLIVGQARKTPDGYKKPLSGYLQGFNNFFNGYFWRMCEHNGWLYLSTFDWSWALGFANRQKWPEFFTNIINAIGIKNIIDNQVGFDLYRSFDGENWVPITTNGLNNKYNIGLRTMTSTPYGLFLGTANPFGPKIMPLNGHKYIPNPRGGCEVFFASNK